MPLPRTRAPELLRRLTALGLVAWLAGAGCVLGCAATMGATAPHHAATPQTHASQPDSHAAARADSCDAASERDCCAGGEAGEGEGEAGRSSVNAATRGGRTAMRCPLGGRQTSDPARKVRFDTTPTTATPAAQSPAPEPSYAAPTQADGAPARDRGSTYLRCCVFMI